MFKDRSVVETKFGLSLSDLPVVWKSLRLDTRERDFEQNSTTLSISAILNDKTGLGRKCDNSENTIANNLLKLALNV